MVLICAAVPVPHFTNLIKFGSGSKDGFFLKPKNDLPTFWQPIPGIK